MKVAMLFHLFFWMLVFSNGLLEKSVEEINDRYSKADLYKLVEKVNSLSREGAIRDRFYKSILKESKIAEPVIVVEYSSSGEAFSYNSRVIGYNKKGVLFRLDYSYYSNQEKIKVKRLRNIAEFKQEMSDVTAVEYDTEEKLSFPSDLMLVSYIDSSSKWEFRLSQMPTRQVVKILSLM